MTVRILEGDCRKVLPTLAAGSIDCCVTSPPYWRMRDYQHPDQIGQEETPDAFIEQLVVVFREVKRVLREHGTLWVNLGDGYASRPNGSIGKESSLEGQFTAHTEFRRAHALRSKGLVSGLKHKDLIGAPWMLAFALRADGWHLRQEIIWSKSNGMPESVTDRCTKSHEHLFLLAKSPRYHFDADAIAEVVAPSTVQRLSQDVESQAGSMKAPGRGGRPMKAVGSMRNSFARATKYTEGSSGQKAQHRPDRDAIQYTGRRNKRSVWTEPTSRFSGAHFAVMPPEVVRNCILAGCPAGGTVLDPFGGAGTTGLVADQLQRDAVLIELNADYAGLSQQRIASDAPLFATVQATAT